MPSSKSAFNHVQSRLPAARRQVGLPGHNSILAQSNDRTGTDCVTLDETSTIIPSPHASTFVEATEENLASTAAPVAGLGEAAHSVCGSTPLSCTSRGFRTLPLPIVDKLPLSPLSGSMHTYSTAFEDGMQRLRNCAWYWGPLSADEAEENLRDMKAGSFLLRDSSNDRYIFTISFKTSSKVQNVRISFSRGIFSFGESTILQSENIVKLIEAAVEYSHNGKIRFFLHKRRAGGAPCEDFALLWPVSRRRTVSSLRHLSRFVVRNIVRKDMLPTLPVSEAVVRYLQESQYFVEL